MCLNLYTGAYTALSFSHRLEILKAAVAAHESIEVIEGKFEGGKVPSDVRLEYWKVD